MRNRAVAVFVGALALIASGCSGSASHATAPATTTTGAPTSSSAATSTTTGGSGPHSSGCLGTDPRLGSLTTGWIQMVSATRGFAALGHTIVGTTDGQHWRRLYRAAEQVSFVDAVDADHAWALGIQSLYTTTDAGRHWSVSPPSAVPLTTVHFVGTDRGWAVSNGTLLQTSDAGTTWQAVPSPCPVDRVCFDDAQHGWLATHDAVYTTSDGGSEWKLVFTVRDPAITQAGVASDLQCTPGNDAWVLFDGRNCGMGSCAYVSYRCGTTGGCTKFSGPASSPGPFSAIDDHTAVFVGFTGPVKDPMSMRFVRADGRQPGPVVVIPDGDPAQAAPQGVSFVNPDRGWIVDGELGESHILATADGGTTWTVQYRSPLP